MEQIGIDRDGGFAEYVKVLGRLVIPAPDNVALSTLALTEPLACVVRAARRANVTFTQSVLVIGGGPIGNLHVQLMRTIGAAPIIVAEISPRRAEMAREAGADVVVIDPAQLERVVRDLTDGRGVDVAIESVGSGSLYAMAQKMIRPGGHLAAFGLTPENEMLSTNVLEMILRENSLAGSVAGMGEDMHDALTLLSHGRIDLTHFTGATYPIEDIQEAFDTLPDRQGDLKTQLILSDI